MLNSFELDNEIVIPEVKGISQGRSDTRFSDPKYQYKPKHSRVWKKQKIGENKKDTPIGRMTNGSWKFIVANSSKFEDSGMQTKYLNVLPTVDTPKEPLKDLNKDKTQNRPYTNNKSSHIMNNYVKERKLSKSSIESKSKVDTTLHPIGRDRTQVKTAFSHNYTTSKAKSKSLPMKVGKRPRLGATLYI